MFRMRLFSWFSEFKKRTPTSVQNAWCDFSSRSKFLTAFLSDMPICLCVKNERCIDWKFRPIEIGCLPAISWFFTSSWCSFLFISLKMKVVEIKKNLGWYIWSSSVWLGARSSDSKLGTAKTFLWAKWREIERELFTPNAWASLFLLYF